MNIKQLQITYHPHADRLLLRISAGSSDEFRFWLTRRLVGLLAEPLGKHLLVLPLNEENVASSAQSSPEQGQNPVRDQAEAAFKHQQAVSSLQSGKTFDSPPEQNFPLGKEPLLVAKLGVTPADKGGVVLALQSNNDQGLSVQLGSPLLHGFCELLVKCSDQAKWGLALNLVPSAEVAEPHSKAVH